MKQILAEILKAKKTYETAQGNTLTELTRPRDVYDDVLGTALIKPKKCDFCHKELKSQRYLYVENHLNITDKIIKAFLNKEITNPKAFHSYLVGRNGFSVKEGNKWAVKCGECLGHINTKYNDGINLGGKLYKGVPIEAFASINILAKGFTPDNVTLISNGGIAQINTAGVSSDYLANNAVNNAHINANAVSSAKIQSFAITAPKIASFAVTAPKIATDAVTSAKIIANAIIASKIGTGQVNTAELASNSVLASKIATGAVNTGELASDAITNVKILNGTIQSEKLEAQLRRYISILDESEVSVLGVTATERKNWRYHKDATNFRDVDSIDVIARLRTTNATHQANFRVRTDSGGGDDLALNTTSATYVIVTGNVDLSAKSDAEHTVEIFLDSANAGESAFHSFLEILENLP